MFKLLLLLFADCFHRVCVNELVMSRRSAYRHQIAFIYINPNYIIRLIEKENKNSKHSKFKIVDVFFSLFTRCTCNGILVCMGAWVEHFTMTHTNARINKHDISRISFIFTLFKLYLTLFPHTLLLLLFVC